MTSAFGGLRSIHLSYECLSDRGSRAGFLAERVEGRNEGAKREGDHVDGSPPTIVLFEGVSLSMSVGKGRAGA